MEDSYLTISSEQTGEGFYTEKRSKFLAFAHHVDTIEEAMELIVGYRRKYYDARHCCYAYMLGSDHEEYRANDDGEPSSTAGKPILGQINSHNLTNILVCVVRYYGGVNLGTGGLITAYRRAAVDAIEHAVIEERLVEETITYEFTYPMMNGVMRVVKEMQPRIVSQRFDSDCSITLAIRRSKAEELKSKLGQLAFDM
ncbi:IMPACT family protein [Hallella multisaccharivorax]|uniref:IMPACT family protein n=1 Tax=Hallella multisaccharivorax TaxID=310514 RepID=UPI0036113900